MPEYLVYDLEIAHCIPQKNERNKPKLTYCMGWGDHVGMGISVLCAYTSIDNRYQVYLEDNMTAFQQMVNQAVAKGWEIVGFNSLSFDDKVCAANGVKIKTTYDLLCEVRETSGQPRFFTPGKTKGGYKLDDLAAKNLGACKSGDGASAPEWWQTGQRGKVISYCLDDVRLTKELFEKRLNLLDPNNGKTLRLPEWSSGVRQTSLALKGTVVKADATPHWSPGPNWW